VIAEIHTQYLEAGADIIETNTFNSNAPSQPIRAREPRYELNHRRPESRARRPTVQRPRSRPAALRRGGVGPTNKTASISPDAERSGFRNIRFDELSPPMPTPSPARRRGADLILLETIFDTLNAKAACSRSSPCSTGAGAGCR